MNSFSRVLDTRFFNQLVTHKVHGCIFDCGTIKLTDLFIISQDENGKDELTEVNGMLKIPKVHTAIISLLDEWPQGLIFKMKEG